MKIHAIRTEGLGDTSYVLVHDGSALVVDPQRDIDRFEGLVNETGAEVRLVLETHLHNDYVSGGRDLARRLGAELVFPAAAAPVFRHRPAFHHEDIEAGSLVVRPLHTPGHTPEHTSYLVLVDGQPEAVFSGGSLLVGSAGRSDLLGRSRAESLARLQYTSVRRLAELPDDVGLYPTHGSGSFCTASGAGAHTSTIGAEKRTNPVLSYPDEDSFAAAQLSALVPYPAYYRYMGPANITGVAAVTDFSVPVVSEEDFIGLESEVRVVDARPKAEFAAGHLPGSVGAELRNDFGVWVGWVLPFNSPLVLVMNPDQDIEEALRQLARIGFDDVRGVITDLPDWQRDLTSYRTAGTEEFVQAVTSGAQVLDVRAPDEWELGTIDGAILAYVPDVVAATPEELDPSRPVWVACESGYRASIAASFLEQRGLEPVVLTGAGVPDLLRLPKVLG
ncbi:MAG TPA: MBL fold metallo-hydrolase [Acidimicrobiia bacterium]|nr:MBL fold metallo-hydrolase [Acidimicrobiia bacterium]